MKTAIFFILLSITLLVHCKDEVLQEQSNLANQKETLPSEIQKLTENIPEVNSRKKAAKFFFGAQRILTNTQVILTTTTRPLLCLASTAADACTGRKRRSFKLDLDIQRLVYYIISLIQQTVRSYLSCKIFINVKYIRRKNISKFN